MHRKTAKILLAIAGVFVVFCVVFAIAGVLFVRSMVHREKADPTGADAAMNAVRTKFNGVGPILTLREDGVAMTHEAPGTPASTRLTAVHVLSWNPRQQSLVDATVPFALFRFKDMPINLATRAGGGSLPDRAMVIRASQIERFGPALLFDQDMPDGSHFLIWTE